MILISIAVLFFYIKCTCCGVHCATVLSALGETASACVVSGQGDVAHHSVAEQEHYSTVHLSLAHAHLETCIEELTEEFISKVKVKRRTQSKRVKALLKTQ